MDVGDVAHENDRAVDRLDRHVVEIGHGLGRIVEVDRELVSANLPCVPTGLILILQGERLANVYGCYVVGAQRVLVEVDLPPDARPHRKGYGS